jgi:hypothetical protein
MKTYYYFILLALFSLSGYSQIINIPDANFKARLLAANTSNGIALNSFGQSIKIDMNNNSEIEISEILNVIAIDVASYNVIDSGKIISLDGIQNFINLKKLKCGANKITSLDLSGLSLLEEIECERNLLNNIQTIGLNNLETLYIFDNNISIMNLSNSPNLINLWCSSNQLTNLDLSSLSSLKWVSCGDNQITNLNVTGLTQIEEIVCPNNLLTNLNVDGLSSLRYLSFGDNQITNINLSSLSSIIKIDCCHNPLSTINVNGLNHLTYLHIKSTLIASLDCSQSGVTQLFCSDNPNLTSINVKNNLVSYSDPDMLFYAFAFENLPSLTSICLDAGEENNLHHTNYNSSGNVILYTGANCSTVVVLPPMGMGINDFEFNNYFSLYPNPVKDIVNIDTKESISVKSINVYNNLGQLIQTVVNPNFGSSFALDVSKLQSGYYFIYIISEKGKTTAKFIKN